MSSPKLEAISAPRRDYDVAAYRRIRSQTEQLAAPLSAEDCALQSMPDASPIKWHLAHTSWFFETFILQPTRPHYRAFHPHFRVLFNSYYNAVGDKHPRPERGMISRPSLDDVRAYRAHVDAGMTELLTTQRNLPTNVRALIELGCHHEQQHQELILMDVKHLLSRNPLYPAYREPIASASQQQSAAAPLAWHDYAGGLHSVGHAQSESGNFAFDNEGPRHQVWLQDFSLASRLVTNGEYLAFIEDGGYTNAEHWLSEGWDTVNAQRWHAPLYWEKRDAQWLHFTLHGLRPLQLDAPALHVSFFEAEAFAQWASKQTPWRGVRLPTEFEWEFAASRAPIAGNFLEDDKLAPLPAPRTDDVARARGVVDIVPTQTPSQPQQLYGDAWEWTRSAYAPYPGFRPAAGAVGEYNGKFMANQFVLRGGSFATPRDHIRATYRNFFPSTTRWMFSGIRLAR